MNTRPRDITIGRWVGWDRFTLCFLFPSSYTFFSFFFPLPFRFFIFLFPFSGPISRAIIVHQHRWYGDRNSGGSV